MSAYTHYVYLLSTAKIEFNVTDISESFYLLVKLVY